MLKKPQEKSCQRRQPPNNPKGDKGKSPKKEQVLTRRQEAERKRIENQKRPKKDEIELPPRKIAFEIGEVSDDEAQTTNPLGVPGHHGAHAPRKNKTKTETVAKVVKQGAHKPKASPPSKPQMNTQKPTEKKKKGLKIMQPIRHPGSNHQ